ncbi:S9 family peptidase [Segatella albensis]|uniref:S9 family peptidase n=1 Tax=Segatella albensis TaxID=77768 RepID=UPI000428CDC0|nr:S9 family peptidase [Segatella albensis]
MKKLFIFCTAIMMAMELCAAEKIDLKSITSGAFSAEYISGINPIEGTDQYASISSNRKQVIRYSFKTGKQTAVLFDADKVGNGLVEEIDGYSISPDGKRLLIQTHTEYVYRRSFKAVFYLYDIKSKKLAKLSACENQQIPTWSPDGSKIAFVYNNNIYITDGDHETQVTSDGKFNSIINGLPDWVNEEEFGFNNAMAWSADSKTLSWIKYDESRVKTYSLQIFKGLKPANEEYSDYPGEYSYKYPKAGLDNSIVSVWTYNLTDKQTHQLPVPLDSEGYIPRIKTTADSHRIVVYTMPRHQDVLNLYAVNPYNQNVKLMIKEQVEKYVKEEAMEGISFGKNTILLPSDRDGYMHLYLYDYNGKLLRKVEKGNYDVTTVYGYDEKTGDVYYQAAAINPHDRQIYVSHSNGRVERLTHREGNNSALFSGDYRFFVNVWSDYNTPYEFTNCTNQGNVIKVLEKNDALKAKIAKYGWTKKKTFSFVTSEGVHLDGWMVKPADFDAKKKYPVILFQYSGPGSQQVMNSWSTGSMGNGGAFDMYLAQHGYIVVCVDGRGTGGRGSDFEKCTYLKIGELESKDQVETAIYMGRLPYVDKNRIGIWGWSFGGFNTLMSMSEGRPVFKAGVSVAPPTNWKYYDTIYTERYMRTPKENPSGYETNPIQRSNKLHGALLICHGVADDNVHPQNTFEYAEALVQADKDFKEVYYTNRNHSIRGGNSRNHLLRQITNWFDTNLK